MIGNKLAHYEITRRVGSGGMGSVPPWSRARSHGRRTANPSTRPWLRPTPMSC